MLLMAKVYGCLSIPVNPMKRIALLFSLAFLPFLGMAQELPKHKKPKATKDDNVLDITKNQGTFLEYETPVELSAEFEKEAKLKMYDNTTKEKKRVELPKGGYLTLTFSRMAIDAADSKWFTIIAKSPTGEEIFRHELDSKIPVLMEGTTPYWKNSMIISVPSSLPTGSIIYVVDGLSNKRHEYLIQN